VPNFNLICLAFGTNGATTLVEQRVEPTRARLRNGIASSALVVRSATCSCHRTESGRLFSLGPIEPSSGWRRDRANPSFSFTSGVNSTDTAAANNYATAQSRVDNEAAQTTTDIAAAIAQRPASSMCRWCASKHRHAVSNTSSKAKIGKATVFSKPRSNAGERSTTSATDSTTTSHFGSRSRGVLVARTAQQAGKEREALRTILRRVILEGT
jgi:hypothetical protein